MGPSSFINDFGVAVRDSKLLEPASRRGTNTFLAERTIAHTHARNDGNGGGGGTDGRTDGLEETIATGGSGDPLPLFSPVRGPAQQRAAAVPRGWDGCRHARGGLRDEPQGEGREGERLGEATSQRSAA